MHKTTQKYWILFDKLPFNLQKVAKTNFELLKSNPKHSSLHFKKVGKVWSIRASIEYRALAYKDEDDYLWFWIGNHDEYERLIGS